MTITAVTQTQALLDEAASLLDALGTAPAATVPADVVLYCLHGAQSLQAAGACATRVQLVEGDPVATIRAALTALSRLDLGTVDADDVLAAGRAARQALALLG